MGLGRNLFRFLSILGTEPPKYIKKASAYRTKKKDRYPYRKHENIILVLGNQAFGVES